MCTIWGSTFLGIRVALESYPPFFLAGTRFLLAGVILFTMLRARGEPSPRLIEWAAACLTGALFFVVGNGFINVAERSVSTGIVSVLVATLPLWMTVFAPFFGRPVAWVEVAGVVLGLSGVVVLNAGGELRASPSGTIFALVAPMGWAVASLASPHLPLPQGTMRSAAQMIGGGAALFIVSLTLGEHPVFLASIRSLAALAYLTVFGSLVGFSAYLLLLMHTRPVVAMSYAYVNPVVAIVLGAALAGEHVGLANLVGAAIVLAAVVLVGVTRARASGAAGMS